MKEKIQKEKSEYSKVCGGLKRFSKACKTFRNDPKNQKFYQKANWKNKERMVKECNNEWIYIALCWAERFETLCRKFKSNVLGVESQAKYALCCPSLRFHRACAAFKKAHKKTKDKNCQKGRKSWAKKKTNIKKKKRKRKKYLMNLRRINWINWTN